MAVNGGRLNRPSVLVFCSQSIRDALFFFKFEFTLLCGIVLRQRNAKVSVLILPWMLQCLTGKCKCIVICLIIVGEKWIQTAFDEKDLKIEDTNMSTWVVSWIKMGQNSQQIRKFRWIYHKFRNPLPFQGQIRDSVPSPTPFLKPTLVLSQSQVYKCARKLACFHVAPGDNLF